MSGRKRLGFLMIVPVVLGARVASAQLSTGEQRCEQAAAKELGKLAVSRAKCVSKCDQQAQKGKVSPSECVPPYAGAALACLTTAVTKAGAGIDKKCVPACPSCYGGGTCAAFRNSRIASVNATLDAEYPLVFCNDSASPDGLTVVETKCRQSAALAATKFAADLAKCYSKCHLLEFKTKIPLGSCVPPTPLDAKTAACKAKAITKNSATIAAKCPDPPECLAAALPTLVQPLAANLTENYDALVFCYSPSGAFLDQP